MNVVSKVISLIGIKTDDRIESIADYSDISYLFNTVLKFDKTLLSEDDIQQIEINQWLNFSQNNFDREKLEKINSILVIQSYLVGYRLSLADLAVFVSVVDALKSNVANLIDFGSLSRWLQHVQNLCIKKYNSAYKFDFPKSINLLIKFSRKEKQLIEKKEETLIKKIEVKKDEQVQSIEAKEKVKEVNINEKTEEKNVVINLDEKKENKIDKKEEKKDKKEKKEKKEAIKEEKDKEVEALDPSKLEIVCGVVIKCWNNENSDKLLCEEIDLGEAKPRSIASGYIIINIIIIIFNKQEYYSILTRDGILINYSR
jgi:hypothetical protein